MKVFLLLTLLLVGKCFGLETNPHVGGVPTKISCHPHQAAMMLYNAFANCSGSIISRTWILSAADCVKENHPNMFSFRVGSTFKSSGGVVYSVKRMVVHHLYNEKNYNYDFALFEMNSEILFTINIMPITLPPMSRPIPADVAALVTGWGSAIQDGVQSNKLLSIRMRVISQNYCYRSFHGGVKGNKVCAKMVRDFACNGDFGGPFTVKGELEGIVSKGTVCNNKKPIVYGRVAYVRDWITKWAGI